MQTQAKMIETILAAPPERYDAILAAAKGAGRRRPINAKRAAEILGVHVKTVHRFGRRGLLTPIRASRRLIRFDQNEVERLAERGVATVED